METVDVKSLKTPQPSQPATPAGEKPSMASGESTQPDFLVEQLMERGLSRKEAEERLQGLA